MSGREHPAARGFARWLDRRRFEHDDPAADNGESLAALWQLWLAEHACEDHSFAPSPWSEP